MKKETSSHYTVEDSFIPDNELRIGFRMNQTVVLLKQIIQEEYIGKVCSHKLASIF